MKTSSNQTDKPNVYIYIYIYNKTTNQCMGISICSFLNEIIKGSLVEKFPTNERYRKMKNRKLKKTQNKRKVYLF